MLHVGPLVQHRHEFRGGGRYLAGQVVQCQGRKCFRITSRLSSAPGIATQDSRQQKLPQPLLIATCGLCKEVAPALCEEGTPETAARQLRLRALLRAAAVLRAVHCCGCTRGFSLDCPNEDAVGVLQELQAEGLAACAQRRFASASSDGAVPLEVKGFACLEGRQLLLPELQEAPFGLLLRRREIRNLLVSAGEVVSKRQCQRLSHLQHHAASPRGEARMRAQPPL
mmetsp:Transcript_24248/g.53865  ORF Transcript_24248/g.53865 Transcript_24248/m.53865 type:complete len:226 (+) Transcript_24248:943-1620(+)